MWLQTDAKPLWKEQGPQVVCGGQRSRRKFRVGRLKHERVKVPRGESLTEWAENVINTRDRNQCLRYCYINFFYCAGMTIREPTLFFPDSHKNFIKKKKPH